MEKHVRFVAFGCIALGALLFLVAGYWEEAARWFILAALTSVVTGWGLLRLKPWARPLAIVLAAIVLLAFPIGTLLGGYALWVLCSENKWKWWTVLRTTLAASHTASALVVASGLVQFYTGPAPQDPNLGPVILFLGFSLLGFPWSVPLYVLTEVGVWTPNMSVMWTLLVLTNVLNTALLWFWALRRKRGPQPTSLP